MNGQPHSSASGTRSPGARTAARVATMPIPANSNAVAWAFANCARRSGPASNRAT